MEELSVEPATSANKKPALGGLSILQDAAVPEVTYYTLITCCLSMTFSFAAA